MLPALVAYCLSLFNLGHSSEVSREVSSEVYVNRCICGHHQSEHKKYDLTYQL
jgi:hypothetical protein